MKKLAFLSFLSLVSMMAFGQNVDMSDYKAVAKVYAENFYTGNYAEAMTYLVKDGRANGMEIRCIEMGACEAKDNFEYKLYGEKVSKVDNQKSILIYWTETSYIEINLEKQEDSTWLVVGSPSKPSQKAVQIKG